MSMICFFGPRDLNAVCHIYSLQWTATWDPKIWTPCVVSWESELHVLYPEKACLVMSMDCNLRSKYLNAVCYILRKPTLLCTWSISYDQEIWTPCVISKAFFVMSMNCYLRSKDLNAVCFILRKPTFFLWTWSVSYDQEIWTPCITSIESLPCWAQTASSVPETWTLCGEYSRGSHRVGRSFAADLHTAKKFHL